PCRKEVERLAPPGSDLVTNLFGGLQPQELVESPSYDRAFSFGQSALEVRGEARDRDRARAPRLFAELMRHPVSRQRSLIERTWRFKNYVFGEYLLEQSQTAAGADPARAEDLAQLGLIVAEQLEGSHYGPALVNDLRARAWAFIGNARRVGTDLRSAEEAFQHAEAFLAEGTDDILLRARLLTLKGSLRSEQRRYDEAAQLLDQALGIYRDAGEDHWVGRTLLVRAKIAQESGAPEEGIRMLEEAKGLIDASKEPRLVYCTLSILAECLRLAGRRADAFKLLPELRKQAAESGTELDQWRTSWIEGQIAQEMNQLDTAEKIFQRLRENFADRGIAYDAAQVSLDLAGVYAQQGRIRELKQLAEEMYPIFRSRDVHREATAALMVFESAAIAERATLQLVNDVASYLREARNHPEMQFRPAQNAS
ncbi:MAG TPA: tetratricopeptide repeat protein, partial [Thermoanaerobaculia bacterium]|nr:tetratricopeptide repeat protein [Thermoanaerobaculia bacterium]